MEIKFEIRLPKFLGKWLAHCKGKVDYKSEATAQKACRDMERKGRSGLEAYNCQQCGGWHIGHGTH